MFPMSLLFLGASLSIVSCTENVEFNEMLGNIGETLTMEANLLQKLQNYIQDQQIRLNTNLRNVEFYQNELEAVLHNIEQQLSSNVKMSLLIKGLAVEWRNVEELLLIKRADNEEKNYRRMFLKGYENLCQGEISLSEEVIKELKCRYIDGGNPFLKIAPFKEEEAFLEPRIVIYHDVISNEEIETLKNLSSRRLQTAASGAIPKFSDYRVAEIAWLDDEGDEHVKSLNRRVALMTNLEMETAEQLQVSYYQTGGCYKPHFDFDIDEENPFQGSEFGNRIATIMFYLTDVEEGGQTVFIHVNVSLTPKMGNAVFWYNLLPNGMGNHLTLHAACPVTKGTKWVVNKWFSERGQEFRRPCPKEYYP